MVEASYRVKECTKRLRRKLRRRPTNEEIAVDTGMPIKRVEAAVNLPKYSVSLDSKIGSTDMTYQVWPFYARFSSVLRTIQLK
jgi:DNA-directed RNA polymerase sigma subunit (sigma70/sigma32)